VMLGLVADGQCFSPVQLQRCLAQQDSGLRVEDLFDSALCLWSYQEGARKPSERPFRHLLELLPERDLQPAQVLHVGSRITHDIAPARKLGMRTALFAGDRGSLQATAEQLKDPATR